MSWSLTIRNGDFDVQQARLSVVKGGDKLVQDFRAAMLESMGNDDMHPSWGTLLDGGVSDGQYVPSIIGETNTTMTRFAIQQEILRVAEYLQQRQVARVQQDRRVYNKPTVSASEILVGVSDITFTQVTDTLFIGVTLQTGSGADLTVSIPVTDPTSVLSS